MKTPKFEIKYTSIDSVEYANAAGMRAYLSKEQELWSAFLSEIEQDSRFESIRTRNIGIDRTVLVAALDRLLNGLENPQSFNNMMQAHRLQAMAPPTASSLVGQLILGLWTNGRAEEAKSVYVRFLTKNWNLRADSNPRFQQLENVGEQLTIAAYASEALPFSQVSSQKLAGARRSVEAQIESLAEEVETFQAATRGQGAAFEKLIKEWFAKASSLEDELLDREHDRAELQDKTIESLEGEQTKARRRAALRLAALKRLSNIHQTKRQQEHDRLVDLFQTQLRLRAPVKLWETRAEEHRTRSRDAMIGFCVLTLVTVIAGATIPFYFGDYIAKSFFSIVCLTQNVSECTREFSAKGPLTVAGILVMISLMMWLVRLQYRVHLSERHLALDASEKQAFAETYLAMKEGDDVGTGNEAIVLASLFRPTQDGIIRDDESSLDLSAAAVLAKQLGRTG